MKLPHLVYGRWNDGHAALSPEKSHCNAPRWHFSHSYVECKSPSTPWYRDVLPMGRLAQDRTATQGDGQNHNKSRRCFPLNGERMEYFPKGITKSLSNRSVRKRLSQTGQLLCAGGTVSASKEKKKGKSSSP